MNCDKYSYMYYMCCVKLTILLCVRIVMLTVSHCCYFSNVLMLAAVPLSAAKQFAWFWNRTFVTGMLGSVCLAPGAVPVCPGYEKGLR